MRFFIALVGLMLTYTLGHAQGEPSENNDRDRMRGDTTAVTYYYIDRPTVFYHIDTTLKGFEDIQVSWKSERETWDLGNLGSPHLFPIYESERKAGFRVGMNQFDRYRLERQDIRYFNIESNRPFTDLYYSQIGQSNSYVKAEFAHQLIPEKVYFSLHYNLINYLGFFPHQQVRNQNFGAAIRFQAAKGYYHGYINMTTNAINYQVNGGLQVDTAVYNTPTDFLANLDVRTQSPETQNRHTDISYTHFLYNGKVDSLGKKSPATNQWKHRISYQRNRYKYFDKTPSEAFYRDFYTNPRGIRHVVQHELLENEISFTQGIGGSLSTAPLSLTAYGQHSWHFVNQEPEKRQIHNIFAGGILEGRPEQAFRYRVQGQLGWAQRALDFFVDGRVGYDFGKFGYLEGKALFQRYQRSLMERRLLISWTEVWNNDFKQGQELSVGGSYTLERLGLRLEAMNHTINNFVYFDSVNVYQNDTTTLNMLQVKLKYDLKVWKLHWENQAVWQPVLSGGEFLRYPELWLKSNLYIESWVFKKAARLKFGASAQFNTNYRGYGYIPVVGQFYLQNERMLTYYPIVDVYVAAKIWQFRFFVSAENILQLFNGQNIFHAVHYPQPNFLVRFGAAWRLFD